MTGGAGPALGATVVNLGALTAPNSTSLATFSDLKHHLFLQVRGSRRLNAEEMIGHEFESVPRIESGSFVLPGWSDMGSRSGSL